MANLAAAFSANSADEYSLGNVLALTVCPPSCGETTTAVETYFLFDIWLVLKSGEG